MVDLDDISVYGRLDPQGMLARIREFPAQCRRAWQQAMDFPLPPGYTGFSKVVILGMGGSAIGGDLAASLAVSEAKAPVIVCRDYNLPAFVDASTLVIASSYSGMTEETLSAFGQALGTKAKKLVITTGSRLRELAETNNIPMFRFEYPAQPRAALPFSLLPILCFLQKAGVIGDKSKEVDEAVQALEKLAAEINETVPQSRNRTKQLAAKLNGRLPVIYGSGILEEVAHRWKTQLNENSKAWAFYELFPELNHNAVVGYEFPAALAGQIFVVLLHSPLLSRRTA